MTVSKPIPLASCRLCGCSNTQSFLVLEGMPRWNHRLLALNEVAGDRSTTLNVLSCSRCGFVGMPPMLSPDYYDEDYVNVPSQSAKARSFHIDQAREFVTRFDLRGRRVLEVGCGDGNFLAAMCQEGAVGHGIEPSSGQCAIAMGRGLNVSRSVLSRGCLLETGPFDAFATRQVFEHIDDLHDFLSSIRANLVSGAAGLVEVPNLDTLLAGSRFFDFIPEHVNYFTSRTLRLALEMNGFEVVEVTPVDDGESLRAFVRWFEPRPNHVEAGIARLREEIKCFVADCKASGLQVAIWGAGGKGLSMMAVMGAVDIALVVDGDPSKHGRFTPVSHYEVRPPDELEARGIGAVIVAAPAYQHEIVNALRTSLGFTGRIALAGSEFCVVR